MKWAHLPVAGGIYDQHPQFIEEMRWIFQRRNEVQEQKRKAEERKTKGRSGRGASRSR
jgi:hypothetical protein